MTAMLPRRRRLLIGLRLGLAAMALPLASSASGFAAIPPTVRLELTGGETVEGELLAVEADAIRLTVAAAARELPVEQVRRLLPGEPAPAPELPVVVTTIDGGRLGGTDCHQQGDRLLIDHPEGPISLPADRVARIAWLTEGQDEPAWLAEMPRKPTADLVVVKKDEGYTFVECAVTAVSDEAVTVVLDGETIPVKRAKLAGVVWLREPATATGPVVTIAGGRLSATKLRWSPQEFVINDSIEVPPALLESIDYAAARTIPLAALDAEATEVEPAFGGLAAVEELAGFFAPRAIAGPGDAPPDLAIRPRTVATWRVPANARQFRARLIRAVPETSPAGVEVTVAVDGRQAFHARLAPADVGRGDQPAAAAIEVDVSAARRLTLTVDFAAGSLGCPVRLIEPVFEQ